MSNPDQIQRILFDDMDVRGVVVGLEDSYRQVLDNHQYPSAIAKVLGEMLAAVSLLSTTLKFEGRLLLQAKGEGNVSTLMAECNHQRDCRAIARYEGEVAEDSNLLEMIGDGYLVLTIEPEVGNRYQGFVPLERDSLAACLEDYFERSEQLQTKVQLHADGQSAAGLMLQVLPAAGTGSDDWQRLAMLAQTLSDKELLELDNETLLFRLFHEEPCRLFPADAVQFRCDCSRTRSANALKMMTEQELLEILAEQGKIEVGCQFCNSSYAFDETDVRTMFSDSANIPPSEELH